MGTLKKFLVYFLIFIASYLIIDFLIYVAMKDDYRDITNYDIKLTSPVISVTECKATHSHGYIKGSITNDTGELITLKYLQINLYDEDGIYLGSEYKELKYFAINETINFYISYNYNNIGKVVINLTDEVVKKESINLFNNINDEQLKIALPIAGFLVLYTLMP